METPVETFGFRSQIEEMGFDTPLVPGGRGGFQRLRLMPPTWGGMRVAGCGVAP